MSSFLGYYVEKPKVTRFPTFQSQSTGPRSPPVSPPAANVHWSSPFHERPAPSEDRLHDQHDEISAYHERSRIVPETAQGAYAPPDEFDEYGAELNADARVWKTYVKESDEFDQDLVEGWNRFVLETSKLLQEDPANATAKTLETIAQTLLLIAHGNQSMAARATVTETLDKEEFAPTRIAVCINILWFLSLALSVAASLIAMLAKEWCYLFMAGRTGQPCLQARRRQQRWDAMGLYDTLIRTTSNNWSSITEQDMITSRALRWLIETCEDPRSVDIALQAIAGADETLPLSPLKECNAPLMISRRLTAGSAHTKTTQFKHVFQLYARALSCFQPSGGNVTDAKPRTCDPEELWIKVRKLQNSTERELDVHLTNQELDPTEDNLLALQIGTSAVSHCLQALDTGPQTESYELINSAVEFLEKTDPNELHDAARLSFITGTQMLISFSIIYCEPPLAARFILRLMEADLSPKYLGVFLALFALSRNDHLGWSFPAPLDSVARATRAIEAVTHYTPILDQMDDETADTLIDFGLLELLASSSSYNLTDRDFEQIRTIFLWIARDQGAQIHTLPERFDIRGHAMAIISAELNTVGGQQAIFRSDASVSAYLTALRQSYNTTIGDPPEHIYVFVVECFFRAPSVFLEDCWGLMGDFPRPILSEVLAHAIDDREILRLLLGALDSQVGDQRIFAISQLALLIKLVTSYGKGGTLAKEWKAIIAEAFQYEEMCKPLEQLRRIGEGLAGAFRDIYEEDQQWSYY
ncbi:hypothetical protein FRC11_005448, partial [Ceratobasidium sp. 423]